ncbi:MULTISPECIES: hypothetical protein [Roseateles]|uniref:hypothetical protein n=1 Tax=Roseateles TaxID=93681 RepID=UPI001056F498|nr:MULTISPECIES: hypothetical protein [Roseateles]
MRKLPLLTPPASPRTRSLLKPLSLAIGLLGASGLSQAVDFSYSGFGNVTLGKVVSAGGIDIGYPDGTQWNCPCLIADFSHGSVYEQKWSLKPESRIGLQGNWTFTPDLSFTAQGVARHAAQKAKADLEWAYLSYNLTPQLTVQLGRKRLPLFFYSDYQDVSYAYSWVRVPPDVYGWAVVNYNGANLTYRGDVAGWAVKSNAYVGSEHTKKNPIAKLETAAPSDINWDQMWGIDLEINRDWFTARLALNKSKQQQFREGVQTSPDPATGTHSPQTFAALSFVIDKDNWLLRSEISYINRSPARGSYRGRMIGAGYRFDKFTPMVTVSQLKAYNAAFTTLVEKDAMTSFSLRYDLSDTSSIKAQYDRSRWDLLDGNDVRRKLVTLSYDFVF